MAKILALKAQTRSQIGRKGARLVRQEGNVPGILYGKREPQAIKINSKELVALLHRGSSENVLVDLNLTHDGGAPETRLALVQDVEHHPLEDYIVHIDLHEVAQDEKLHTEVPVESVGEPAGVKNNGGLLENSLRHLTVECLPRDLPEVITVDVSALEIDDVIHVSDIKLPENVEVLNPADLVVFSVAAPKEEVAPTPAAEVKQPEVIKEKKVDENAAPAAGADKGAAKKK